MGNVKKQETIFTQIGAAATKIVQKLSSNKELGRYLKYMVIDPLDPSLEEVTFSDLLNKNIRSHPLLRLDELTEGFIIVSWDTGSIGENLDFSTLTLAIDIFVNIQSWAINNDCQRPFIIMDYIYRDLQNLRVSGIGKLKFDSFELKVFTDEYSQHKMWFYVDVNSSNENFNR